MGSFPVGDSDFFLYSTLKTCWWILNKLLIFTFCKADKLCCLLNIKGFLHYFTFKNYAQTLVDADRTSLFLVDNRTNELYARIFDIGGSLEDSRSSNLQKEIRWYFDVRFIYLISTECYWLLAPGHGCINRGQKNDQQPIFPSTAQACYLWASK